MKYLVIGLGVFGYNLAVDLTDIGHEVIAVDENPEAVEKLKDIVSTTYILDTSHEESMLLLPLTNIDVAIVTIGNNFGASIKTVALLKKQGVKRLMVRASDEIHEAILESMGIEKILTPEKKSALNLVNELTLNEHVESFNINAEYYIFKFEAVKSMIGNQYSALTPANFYNLRIIAATRPVQKRNIIGVSTINQEIIDINKPDAKIAPGDVVTVYGTLKDFRSFNKYLSD